MPGNKVQNVVQLKTSHDWPILYSKNLGELSFAVLSGVLETATVKIKINFCNYYSCVLREDTINGLITVTMVLETTMPSILEVLMFWLDWWGEKENNHMDIILLNIIVCHNVELHT